MSKPIWDSARPIGSVWTKLPGRSPSKAWRCCIATSTRSLKRRTRFLDLARSSEREMRSILSDGQVQRLDRIRIQLVGFLAFSEPKIVKALELVESRRRGHSTNRSRNVSLVG